MVVVAVILSREYRMREHHRGWKSGNCKRMLICSIFFCWGSQGSMPLRRKIRFRTIRQAVSAFELMPQKKRRRKKKSLDKSLLNGCLFFSNSNTRSTIRHLRQRRTLPWYRSKRILYTRLQSLPPMASALLGAIRATPIRTHGRLREWVPRRRWSWSLFSGGIARATPLLGLGSEAWKWWCASGYCPTA